MLSSTGKKILIFISAAIAVWLLGFVLGRSTMPKKVSTEIKYLPGKIISDTIYVPTPVKEVIAPDTLNIIKYCIEHDMFKELFGNRKQDTVTVTKQDSSIVISDWATQRLYSSTLFDNDTLGKFSYNANVQYNRLQSFDYTFTPVTKTVTVKERYIKKFSPFIGAGIVDGPSFVATGGAFFNEKWGVSLLYMRDTKQRYNNFGGMVLYKF